MRDEYDLELEESLPLPVHSLSQLTKQIHAVVKRDYAHYHAPRFAFVLQVLARHVKEGDKILDMGASELTWLIRHTFQRPVDILDIRQDVKSEWGNTYFFDLNTVGAAAEEWRQDLPTYDVVVMAEVFEHLYASPQSIFRFLNRLVKPGGLLILQTPNGMRLQNRLKVFLGRHPFDPLRDDDKFGSHVREYTPKELRRYAQEAGYAVLETHAAFYFDLDYVGHTGRRLNPLTSRIKKAFYPLIPTNLQQGITMTLRKKDYQGDR